MREITGKELERALLKTQGRTWDKAVFYKDSEKQVTGPLIEQVDKTVDLVYTKYMKAQWFE